jgi:hypothetical protein
MEMLTADTTRRLPADSETRYRCQATDLLRASTPLGPWELGQYVRDVRSGNVGLGSMLQSICWSVFRFTRERLVGYRLQIWIFNTIQRLRGGPPLLHLAGTLTQTPLVKLGLAPGERVRIRGVEEIKATLDPAQKNRGLYFDIEMVPFCGRTHEVRQRVTQIIEESTGRMIKIPGPCVILEGAVCTGKYHKYCPRAIYPFWREAWLERADGPECAPPAATDGAASVESREPARSM